VLERIVRITHHTMTGRVPMSASRISFTVTCLVSLLLLPACGSGDLGGILGGGDTTAAVTDVRGTVDRVDTRERVIVLRDAVTGTRSLRGTETGTMVQLRYDDRTTVTFQGRDYRPEDLEPGDRIEARVDDSSRTMLATRIEVTHDVRTGTGTGTVGGSSTIVRGEVRAVDTRNRMIDLDRTDGTRRELVRLEYDNSTTVDFRGRQYRPEALERGDSVDVRVRTIGNRLIADQIVVVQSVSGTSSPSTGDVRGTVRLVDTRARTIELERTSWGTRFTTTPQGDRVVLDYTADTIVEFQGNRYTPENLEPGDEIEVWLDDIRGRSTARRIVVVRDARAPRF
jgi:hypothetical protein